MGVYYIVVNDTKKEYVDPADFDENFKLGGELIRHPLLRPLKYSSLSNPLALSSRILVI